MKKHFAALGLASAMSVGGLAVGGFVTPAYAADPTPDCSATVTDGCWIYQWSETQPSGEGWVPSGETRQVESTWDEQWAIESPGEGWVQSGETREIELEPSQTVDRLVSEEWTEVIKEEWTEVIEEAWTETIEEAWTETVVLVGGYAFVHTDPNHPKSPRFENDPNWNSNGQSSFGWLRDPSLDRTAIIEHAAETIEHEAVTEFHEAVTEFHEAVYETVTIPAVMGTEFQWRLETEHFETRWMKFIEADPGDGDPGDGDPGDGDPGDGDPGDGDPGDGDPGDGDPGDGDPESEVPVVLPGNDPDPITDDDPVPGTAEDPAPPVGVIVADGIQDPVGKPSAAPKATAQVAPTAAGTLPNAGGPDGALAALGVLLLGAGGLLIRRGRRISA